MTLVAFVSTANEPVVAVCGLQWTLSQKKLGSSPCLVGQQHESGSISVVALRKTAIAIHIALPLAHSSCPIHLVSLIASS